MTRDVIEIAKELIKIPGYTEIPEKETLVAKKLFQMLKVSGLPVRLIDVEDGRYNVSCIYESGVPGPQVTLCTHLDTVPPYDMPDPFNPRVENGRLYGRGAVDVRDILAAMFLVMVRLFRERPPIRGSIEFLAVADEESGSCGMRHALSSGFHSDLTIVGEPTDLNLGIAHKGVCWIKASFLGKSAHGSVPEQGHNAIDDASRFITASREYQTHRLDRRVHALHGRPTLNVGQISGGTRPTIVPDHCEVYIDRRLVPGETADQAVKELSEVLEECMPDNKAYTPRVEIILGNRETPFPPLDSTGYQMVIQLIREALCQQFRYEPQLCGLPFWTDASLPNFYLRKPAIVIGPGNIKQAHSNDEWVEISQLKRAVEVYYEIVKAVCACDIEQWW